MAGPRFQQHQNLGVPSSDFQIQNPLRLPRDEGLPSHRQKSASSTFLLGEICSQAWAPAGFISFRCHVNIFLLWGSPAA